jgi:hypothetical protein
MIRKAPGESGVYCGRDPARSERHGEDGRPGDFRGIADAARYIARRASDGYVRELLDELRRLSKPVRKAPDC